MTYKKIIIFALVLVVVISLSGCKAIDTMKNLVTKDEPDVEIIRSNEDDVETISDPSLRDTVLYYQNGNGYLVPVKRQIPWEEGIAKAALRNIVDSPIVREDIGIIGLLPIIPAGTGINGMAISEEGICKVDFTEEVMNYQTETEEANLVKGVVYTLTEFPTISKVQIMIGGKTIDELKFGTRIKEPIERKNINMVDNYGDEQSNVIVYYKGTDNGEYEYYVPVTVPTMAPQANAVAALEELFKGAPELSGLYTDIPQGVYLQGAEVNDGIAYVDLLLEAKDTISEQVVFDKLAKNIALTVKEFDDVEDVEILIDGKTLDQAGLDLLDPDYMPVFANEY